MSRGKSHATEYGFTLTELSVLMVIVVLLMLYFYTLMVAPRPSTRIEQNYTQLRGIHAGLVLFSQGNSSWYPGLDSHGNPIDISVAGRFKTLLDGNYFTAGYLINPNETNPNIKPWTNGPFTSNHYSYAMLSIASPGARRSDWRDNTNALAPMLSDRNIGADAHQQVKSVWTSKPGDWRGAVVFGDNSTSFLATHLVPETRYDHVTTKDDNLFDSLAGDDALMMYVETAPMIANPSTQPANQATQP